MTQSPEAFMGRPHVNPIALLASAARTATSTGETAVTIEGFDTLFFEFDVTAAATDAGDTLDVFIQTKVGSNWVDIVHFTQAIGTGGAKRYISKITRETALTEFETGTALGAAAVRNIIGSTYRVRYAIVNVSAVDVSFTFSVTASAT